MSATDGSVPWEQRSSQELGEFLCRTESKEHRPEIIEILSRRLVREIQKGYTDGNGSTLAVVLELFGTLSDTFATLDSRVANIHSILRDINSRTSSVFD